MDLVLAVVVGLFIALGVYLLLSRALIRMLMGMLVLGNGVNLLIFTAGRLTREVAPIVPPGLELKQQQLNAGDLSLMFADKTRQVTIRQIAVAQIAHQDQSVIAVRN